MLEQQVSVWNLVHLSCLPGFVTKAGQMLVTLWFKGTWNWCIR